MSLTRIGDIRDIAVDFELFDEGNGNFRIWFDSIPIGSYEEGDLSHVFVRHMKFLCEWITSDSFPLVPSDLDDIEKLLTIDSYVEITGNTELDFDEHMLFFGSCFDAFLIRAYRQGADLLFVFGVIREDQFPSVPPGMHWRRFDRVVAFEVFQRAVDLIEGDMSRFRAGTH